MSSKNISGPNDRRLATLSWTERLGYGVGDAGFNFYWALIGTYLAAFYTDTLGPKCRCRNISNLISKNY
jgi:Na+/melibiose symporter-like transporter